MSGRDTEPVTAFFPSIDRNLMADLDRHLRGAPAEPPAHEPDPAAHAPEPAAHVPEPAAPEPIPAGRLDISGVIEAVEHAGSSMAAMAERIQELEAHGQDLEERVQELEAAGQQLTVHLGEVTQQRDVATASLRAETERVQRLEKLAAHHVSRATGLERDLGGARADLAKVVDAISQALGAPGAPRE